MNRYVRVKEHLDTLSLNGLRFCTADGPCACMGCAGSVSGSQVREHELLGYVMGTLIPGQQQRADILERQHDALSEYPDPDNFIFQFCFMKNGEVWGSFLRRSPDYKPSDMTVNAQLTGRFNKGLRILEYKKP